MNALGASGSDEARWEDSADGTFEVVDDLEFDEVVDEGPSTIPPASSFARLLSAIEAVTTAAGRPDAVARVNALLGTRRLDPDLFDGSALDALSAEGFVVATEEGLARAAGFERQVRAWRSVLEDGDGQLSDCGPAGLDEWCARLLAFAMGRGSLADGLRRDLRRRGVAAFGMVDAAA